MDALTLERLRRGIKAIYGYVMKGLHKNNNNNNNTNNRLSQLLTPHDLLFTLQSILVEWMCVYLKYCHYLHYYPIYVYVSH